MLSAHPSKSQPNHNQKKAVAQKGTTKARPKRTASSTQSSWDEVREFFDNAELKLEKFGEHVDRASEKMEKGAEKKLQQTQAWLLEQAKNLKATESKVEQLFDIARVKAHLGKMDATEAAEEMLQRVDRLIENIDKLTAKASSDTADGLKKLSEACLKLRSKLIH